MAELESFFEHNRPLLTRQYIRGLNVDMVKHQTLQMFGRNVVAMQQRLLADLKPLMEQGVCQPDRLAALLAAETDTLLQAALQHNRSSCAVSNFPEEHQPSGRYIAEVLLECEKLNVEFLNALSE